MTDDNYKKNFFCPISHLPAGGQFFLFSKTPVNRRAFFDWRWGPGICRRLWHRRVLYKMNEMPEQFCRRLSDATPPLLDERSPLVSVLISTNWNISKAAQKLHWSRMTIYRKMAKYHIIGRKTGKVDVIQGKFRRISDVL